MSEHETTRGAPAAPRRLQLAELPQIYEALHAAIRRAQELSCGVVLACGDDTARGEALYNEFVVPILDQIDAAIADAVELERRSAWLAGARDTLDEAHGWWLDLPQFEALSGRATLLYRALWMGLDERPRYGGVRLVEATAPDKPESTIDDHLMPLLGADATRRDLALARDELLAAGFLTIEDDVWRLPDCDTFHEAHPKTRRSEL